MTKISEPKIQRLPISDIEVDAENRLRPVSEAGVQSLVGRLSSGEVKSVAEGLGKLQPSKTAAKDPEAEAYQKLAAAWDRAPMKVKRRFVADQSAELLGLLKDLDGGL
ncbi:MAG: hypothetical protein ACK5M4_12375 [Pseudorhodobacter sp.]